jgi:hypothetical protein
MRFAVNLIAAALARGKTGAGLGIFCLEVHSHKTQKGALLRDLEQRYSLRGSLKDPRDLDRHLAVVDEKKAPLTQYAALVNRTIEPFGATVFDILWARDRCGQDVVALKPVLVPLTLPDTVKITRTQFSQAEQFVAVYAQHLAAVLAPGKSMTLAVTSTNASGQSTAHRCTVA